jgi:hypothetical protein
MDSHFLRPLLAATLLSAASAAGAADALTPWTAAHDEAPPVPWRVTGLPNQNKPFTRFSIESWAGVKSLRVEADRSYGNLLHPLAPSTSLHRLQWRWMLDEPNPGADLHERSHEDTPLRVCALFDMPLDKVGALDRALLAYARATSSDPVPAATVCYVWDEKLAPGTALHSAFTGRLRMIVLRSHEAPLHAWLGEQRDLDADFKRLFGDEADKLPPLIGIAVGGDADNTQAHSLAHLGAITLEP